MTKPSQFRLQTLFQVRERAKKSAEEALVVAQQKVRREQQELDQLVSDLSQKKAQRDQKRHQYLEEASNGVTTVGTLRIQECHIQALKAKEELLKTHIERQEGVVKKTQESADEHRFEMLHANREFKTVEKLKDKWAIAVRKAFEYKEENTRDEISQARYVSLKDQQ